MLTLCLAAVTMEAPSSKVIVLIIACISLVLLPHSEACSASRNDPSTTATPTSTDAPTTTAAPTSTSAQTTAAVTTSGSATTTTATPATTVSTTTTAAPTTTTATTTSAAPTTTYTTTSGTSSATNPTTTGGCNSGWIGDNYCDDINNNVGCSYDGGDCCGCNVNTQYCSVCGCLDPNASGGGTTCPPTTTAAPTTTTSTLSTTHDPGKYESVLLVFLLCTGVKFQKVTRMKV